MTLPRPELLVECRPAPNPRRVRIFLAEKGLEIPTEQVDIMTGAHFGDHAGRVGTYHVPALKLSDGSWLTESMAICRYVEALVPEPCLMGADALSAARIEMWQRRVEFELFSPIAQVLRHGNPKMAVLEDQCPEWAEANIPRVHKGLAMLERRLGESLHVGNEDFSVADITAVVALDFLRTIRIEIQEQATATRAWFEKMGERPSVMASRAKPAAATAEVAG
ncbi:glutathione S-transferase family protein [Amaricoccus tamworthensis]|uniref:glutathione S-transferase family protein n=1 Tax=Amaricoccus tamworthensis TaxID=57002 RepID=UPI003C7A4F22